MSRQKSASKTPTIREAAVKRRPKTARVEARTSPTKKAFYQRAAELKGQTFSDFVETSLDEAAERAHKEFELIELSQREAKAFVQAVLADATPSTRLTAAAKQYRARTET